MRPYTVHGISENEATNEIIIKKKKCCKFLGLYSPEEQTASFSSDSIQGVHLVLMYIFSESLVEKRSFSNVASEYYLLDCENKFNRQLLVLPCLPHLTSQHCQ